MIYPKHVRVRGYYVVKLGLGEREEGKGQLQRDLALSTLALKQ